MTKIPELVGDREKLCLERSIFGIVRPSFDYTVLYVSTTEPRLQPSERRNSCLLLSAMIVLAVCCRYCQARKTTLRSI
jgi:hypothetical protein